MQGGDRDAETIQWVSGSLHELPAFHLDIGACVYRSVLLGRGSVHGRRQGKFGSLTRLLVTSYADGVVQRTVLLSVYSVLTVVNITCWFICEYLDPSGGVS